MDILIRFVGTTDRKALNEHQIFLHNQIKLLHDAYSSTLKSLDDPSLDKKPFEKERLENVRDRILAAAISASARHTQEAGEHRIREQIAINRGTKRVEEASQYEQAKTYLEHQQKLAGLDALSKEDLLEFKNVLETAIRAMSEYLVALLGIRQTESPIYTEVQDARKVLGKELKIWGLYHPGETDASGFLQALEVACKGLRLEIDRLRLRKKGLDDMAVYHAEEQDWNEKLAKEALKKKVGVSVGNKIAASR